MRGLVISDVFRRFVSKAIAFELAPAFHAATAPFQYALSTRADAEAAARVRSFCVVRGWSYQDVVVGGLCWCI